MAPFVPQMFVMFECELLSDVLLLLEKAAVFFNRISLFHVSK